MELPVIQSRSPREHRRLPAWLKKKLGPRGPIHALKADLRARGLHTVCEEASCPNLGECWSAGTATFMILGDVCTRHCAFCDVRAGQPAAVDASEPAQLAEMTRILGLRHVVITCVARDDLEDKGAAHFVKCIREVRDKCPETKVEILTTDFALQYEAIDTVIEEGPDVFNHNIETVARLSERVRHRASYAQTLRFLRYIKTQRPDQVTKSGLMLGLGETEAEVVATLKDLRAAGCDIVTIGQYLRPAKRNLPVAAFISPEQFEAYKAIALEIGFDAVASGPFVRSSYHAEEMVK